MGHFFSDPAHNGSVPESAFYQTSGVGLAQLRRVVGVTDGGKHRCSNALIRIWKDRLVAAVSSPRRWIAARLERNRLNLSRGVVHRVGRCSVIARPKPKSRANGQLLRRHRAT